MQMVCCKTLKFRGTPKADCYEPFLEKEMGPRRKTAMENVTTQSDTSEPKGEQVMGYPEPSAKTSDEVMHAVQRVDVGRYRWSVGA